MAKTPTTMIKYLKREDDTEEFFEKDGFVHVGDEGYYDEEGRLYFRDRIKELLKVLLFSVTMMSPWYHNCR